MSIYKVTPINFEMFAGNAKRLNITVLDQDEAAVDISGSTLELTISRRPRTATLVTVAGSIVNGPSGVALVDIPAVDTESLHGAYFYDIKLVDNTGRPTTIIFGSVAINRAE